MSSDTAAFFAKKKGKKKKVFKFNANNIDAAQVSTTIHVDAPAVSSEAEPPSINSLSVSKNVDTKAGEWEEAKATVTAPTTTSATPAAAGNGPAELLDMKALERKRNEQDDIAERMRVEETKAKLAAARVGMEKEAQRLKVEKEAKDAKKKERKETNASSRFGAAASNIGSNGGSRWVPPHMRSSGLGAGGPAAGGMGAGRSSGGPRFGAAMSNMSGSSSGYQRKVDTASDELFPDLGTAEKMIAKEEDQKQAAVAAAQKKMKAKAVALAAEKKKADRKAEEAAEAKAQAEAEAKAQAEAKAKAEAAAKAKAAASDGAAPKKKVVKKKKKKDLSTFKKS